MSAASGSSSGGLYFIAIILLFIVIRIRRIINGTKVSFARTIGYSAWYIIFSILVLSGSFFIGIPTTYFIMYPILFLAAFYAAYELAGRQLVFWKSNGSVYSKGGIIIYLIYVAGLLSRFAIGYEFIGPNFFFSFSPQAQTLSSTAIAAAVVTDLLLMAGVGLLFGRNMRILKTYMGFKKGNVAIPEEPSTQGDTNPSSSVPS